MTLDEQLSEAARLLREVEPAACLVLPRVLRRVIKEHGEFGGLALHVPHRKCYLIEVDKLLWYVSPDEIQPSSPATDRAILIAYPDEQELEGMAQPQLLRELWRTLFHARIHADLDSDVAIGRLSPQVVHARIDQIGQAAFDEVVAVLRQENFLLSPDNVVHNYIEFVAVWAELGKFDPAWRPSYFPAIDNPAEIDAIIAEDVDVETLYRQTRLLGAALPGEPSAAVLEPTVRSLLQIAQDSSQRGNAVRAALVRNHVSTIAPPGYVAESLRRANEELDRLCDRLQVSLQFSHADKEHWRRSLVTLLANSKRGFWDADKRILYDLQNACIDHERELSVLDPVAWLFTLGRRPLKRPLPHLREVLIARHLRKAQHRLSASQLEDVDRDRLRNLLRTSAEAAEERMRHQFRPILTNAVLDAGLVPANLPERVALAKVVEELLDVIVERGFLTIGILRDALSRNNLKCPDFPERLTARAAAPDPALAGDDAANFGNEQRPVVLPVRRSWAARVGHAVKCGVLAMLGMAGSTDPLLRMDKRLSRVLDGVYRRGDAYLRVLQGVSAAAFGTRTGRFLTKFVVLPVGGAYVVLMGLQHLVATVAPHVNTAKAAVSAAGAHAATTAGHVGGGHGHESALPDLYAWAGVSLFLFGMLHIPPFRTLILRHVLWAFFQALKGIVYDVPRWILKLPWVHRLVFSRAAALVHRILILPLIVTGVVWWLIPWFGSPRPHPWWFLLGYAIAAVVLNSRIGRDVEELSTEAVGRMWFHIRSRILVALYELVMDTFKQILESLERVLYAVDEWLRFRSGESSTSLAFKAVLGTIWAAVNYVIRFLVNLLLEPQINPIKHFPVVTVSHKLMFIVAPYVAAALAPALGTAYANLVTSILLFSTPGIFGFLVWELKENWRLFEANRPRSLAPAVIGHHGESLIRLMKPGLHSGTLPKLFAKMRRAHRKSYLARSRALLTQYHESLHHLELAIRHFFERELVALVTGSPAWDAPPLEVGQLHLASNSIRVELVLRDNPALSPVDEQESTAEHSVASLRSHADPTREPGHRHSVHPPDPDSVWLTFEEQSGWLLASVSQTGWINRLSPGALATFEAALLGIYKLGGVDLIREQIVARFEPHRYPYDIREQKLVLWPDPEFRVELHYNFEEQPARARPRAIARPFALPDIDSQQLIYSDRPLYWAAWTAAWNAADTGTGPQEPLAEPPEVLARNATTPRLRLHQELPAPRSAAGL